MRAKLMLVCVFLLLLGAISVLAIGVDDPTPTPDSNITAETPTPDAVNSDAGVATISGVLPITNVNVKKSSMRPLIILEDQKNFVTRDFEGDIPENSQVIAHFTTDFYANGPVGYQLDLPAVPQGTFVDVDQNGQADPGVQIYQVGYWDDRFGEVYLDRKEIYAWSSAYSSARVDDDPSQLGEINGGKLIVYVGQAGQGFPDGFGADGRLFTADDPIVALPMGWTVVNMDTETFTFDRQPSQTIDLIEPDSLVLDDFSAMNYLDAFDALIAKARNEYSFTQQKNLDWDELSARFRPLFEQAQQQSDRQAYFDALDQLVMAIPDGHVAAYGSPRVTESRRQRLAGSVGMNLRELSDGRILVNFILEGGPAQQAGIQVGAEVTAINNTPLQDYLPNVQPVSGPFSNAEMLRLAQVAYAARFPLNTTAIVTYRNPNEDEQTARMSVVEDNYSLAYGQALQDGTLNDSPYENPVEYYFNRDGIGVIEVNTFDGYEALIVGTWDYFLDLAQQIGSPGIVIDLRTNGGGFSYIGNRLAATLYREDQELYRGETYSDTLGMFYSNPLGVDKIEIDPDSPHYDGKVAVLVGPGCASACEFFAFALTRNNRSTVVGQYGTYAIGGGWSPTYMPEGITFALPTNRKLTPDGAIVVEGSGIQPTLRVPVDESNFDSASDVVLQAALDELAGR